jgi:hypothetical protein
MPMSELAVDKPQPLTARDRIIVFLILGVVVVFLAVAQVRVIRTNFRGQIGAQVQASQGIVEGLPHWRIYQSRVLGPYTVHAVARVTGWPIRQAYDLMMFVWLAVFFGVLTAAAWDWWRSPVIAAAAAASAAFLNAMLMQGEWLYPWDYIDLTIFTLMVWAVTRRKPLGVLVIIIAVEIVNREAATIIAGWLALDALLALTLKSAAGVSTRDVGSAKRQLAAAVGLIILSQTASVVLRAALFVREVGPDLYPDASGPGTFLALQLVGNLSELAAWLIPQPNVMLAYALLVIAIPILCGLGISAGRDIGRISVLFLVLWAFTLCFGLVGETRVWLAFVPYLVLVAPRLQR